MKLKHKLTPIIFVLLVFISVAVGSFAPVFQGKGHGKVEAASCNSSSYIKFFDSLNSGCTDPQALEFFYNFMNNSGSGNLNCTTNASGDKKAKIGGLLIMTSLYLQGAVSDSDYRWDGGEGITYTSTYSKMKAANPDGWPGETATNWSANALSQREVCDYVVDSWYSKTVTELSTDKDAAATKLAILQILNAKLQPLIDKQCAASETPGAPTYCSDKFYAVISACFDQVFPKIKPGADANEQFANRLATCIANARSGVKPKITKQEILDLLGTTLYDDAIAAVNAEEDASGDGTEDLGCEGSGPLSWLLCGVIGGLQDLVGNLYDHVIQPLLETAPLSTEDVDKNGIFQAWKNFRVYGDVFLVIGILVIVFGESIGGGLIDAYTAKKVLPRLLIAAVLINLSFYIVAILVDIMNITGRGMMALITAPFGDLPSGFNLDFGVAGGVGLAAILGGALVFTAAGVSGAFLSWFFLVILLPMALLMLAILATVLIRHALIIFLVIISPFAFALYCLPNTEKYFRQWWEMLFKTLLVYPIIAALFAMGKVSAYLISNLEGSVLTGGIGDIIAVVALFVPLLLIPFAFKIAGGVLGRAFDAVDGVRARGNKYSEGRREQSRQRLAAVRATRSARTWDQVGRGAKATGVSRVPGIGWALGRKIEANDQKLRNFGADIAKTPGAQAVQHDDDALRAATYGSYLQAVSGLTAYKRNLYRKGLQADVDSGKITAAEADALTAGKQADFENDAKRASRAAQTGVGFGIPQGTWAAQQMIATGTAIASGDHEDVAEIIARVGGRNDSTRASLAGNMNAQTKNVGRHDLASSFGTMASLAEAKALGRDYVEEAEKDPVTGRIIMDPTTGKAKVKQVKLEEAYKTATKNAWNSASLYQHANDKPQNIRASIEQYSKQLASADTGEREEAAIYFNELRAMQPNASGEVRNEIDKALEAHANTVASVINGLPASVDSPAINKTSVPRDRTGNPIPDPNNPTEPMVVARRETAQERVERRSRTYERPDINKLQT
jgi:hypothetical protein